ncbi:peptidoglycan/xylan/chitin deacetylase (PgdA/CDA1 family) [Kitasatospora gansuensis]|uniref:Peptidoglycan/xylan/chitin deacetylase (PgdA/CDA1 family) n=1 Tax=Kitasatospora gansuensis TaxID=258050 RepID=A0A7W7SJ56_9ACTN|nr:polysaccharide deacetylase family protein [Kitasatospora gansuensis]MBB4951317.1 peptidoglycan/xylan/chitin deacetylase (PgdA/CDA1 family) [Kitasatospora gansuensis]
MRTHRGVGAVLLTMALALPTALGVGLGTAPEAAAKVGDPTRPLIVRGSTWYLRDSLTTGTATTTFGYGAPGDLPMSGDWDGNGSSTPGVVRGGIWYLRNSNTSGVADTTFGYGDPGDVPVAGDWDGNGTTTPGIVRGTTWYLRNSNTTGVADTVLSYGDPGDVPVTGDWDGNGTTTPGIVRGTTWYLRNSNTSGVANVSLNYGNPGDRPVVGDWDGNGSSTPGIVRGSTWYLRNSNASGVADVSFGFGDTCDLGLSTASTLIRDRGGRPLPASFAGRHLTVLPTGANVVALTFDAGANAAGLPKILGALQNSCVPATFFLTGAWTENFPQDARVVGLRYPTGNHSFSHPDLTTLGDAAVRDQILHAQAAIQAGATYDARPLFRFPFGAADARTLGIVNSLGYASVNWTVDTLGWQGTSGGQSVSTVVSRVLANLRPGEIVLMHVGSHPNDGSTLDADALPTVIAELTARGYSFVTVPQFM